MACVVPGTATVMVGAMPFRFIVPAKVMLLTVHWLPRVRLVPAALKIVGSEITGLRAFPALVRPIVPLNPRAHAAALVPSEVLLFTIIVPPVRFQVSEAALAFGWFDFERTLPPFAVVVQDRPQAKTSNAGDAAGCSGNGGWFACWIR